MVTSSLRERRPHLEAIFGALTVEDDAALRARFDALDDALLGLARHFGGARAGWGGTGLELTWNESGQVRMASFVEPSFQDGRCLSFYVELTPSWFYGDRAPTTTWNVEASVSVRCDHPVDCGMHIVWSRSAAAASPLEAARALGAVIDELVHLAKDTPVEEWYRRDTRAAAPNGA